MNRYFLFFIALLFYNFSVAQSIVNTEKLFIDNEKYYLKHIHFHTPVGESILMKIIKRYLTVCSVSSGTTTIFQI